MYCVLGANGFIGRNIAKNLGVKGYTREDLDLLDSEAVDTFFKENSFDTVIHCSVVGGSRLKIDDADVFLNNIKMFENVARHANKFKRFVWFSSGAAIHAQDSPYGFSKYICEKLAKQIPNCQVFRIYGCYGEDEPSTRFITSCLSGSVTIKQNRLFDFFWVGDIHKVITKFTICDGKIRDLVYKTKWSLYETAILNKTQYITIENDNGSPYIGEFDEEIGNAIGVFDRHPVMCTEKKSITHDCI